MPFLHPRSMCDACHVAVATHQSESGCWFCASCATSFTEFTVTSAPPKPTGVNAAVAVPMAAAATISVSDGAPVTSPPEMLPSATLATAPSGFNSRVCEGNGSNADGSKTSDGSARYSSCGLDSSQDLKSSGIDDGATFDGSHTVAATRSRLAGIASGPQDSIATGDGARSADVPDCAVVGRELLNFDDEVSALEAGWRDLALPAPSWIGVDLASGPDVSNEIPVCLKRGADNIPPFAKNASTFATAAASAIADADDKSKSETVGA